MKKLFIASAILLALSGCQTTNNQSLETSDDLWITESYAEGAVCEDMKAFYKENGGGIFDCSTNTLHYSHTFPDDESSVDVSDEIVGLIGMEGYVKDLGLCEDVSTDPNVSLSVSRMAPDGTVKDIPVIKHTYEDCGTYEEKIDLAFDEHNMSVCKAHEQRINSLDPTSARWGERRVITVDCENKTVATEMKLTHPELRDINSGTTRGDYLQTRVTESVVDYKSIEANCSKFGKMITAIANRAHPEMTHYGIIVRDHTGALVQQRYVKLEECK